MLPVQISGDDERRIAMAGNAAARLTGAFLEQAAPPGSRAVKLLQRAAVEPMTRATEATHPGLLLCCRPPPLYPQNKLTAATDPHRIQSCYLPLWMVPECYWPRRPCTGAGFYLCCIKGTGFLNGREREKRGKDFHRRSAAPSPPRPCRYISAELSAMARKYRGNYGCRYCRINLSNWLLRNGDHPTSMGDNMGWPGLAANFPAISTDIG